MAGRGIIWQLPKRKLNTRSTYFGGLAPLKVGASELLSFVRVDFAHEAVQGLKCPSFPKPYNGTRSSYHHASFASNSLRQSTDNFSRSYNVHRGGSSSNIWGLRWRCGFHSQSFHKSQWFSPLSTSTRYVGRSCSFFDIQRCYSSASREQKSSTSDRKSQRMLLYLVALVFAMVGSSYAAVPLYRRFCQATGYGGTVQRRESVEEKIARHTRDGTMTTRDIVVQFNADIADGMQWKFVPTQREVRVKPGESALAFYTAENLSSTPITGVSTYNVTPMKAAIYFNKIQCFCFEEQRLLPGEQIDMPVFFYIDPEFETDPKMDGINNIILSYTFFKVSEE